MQDTSTLPVALRAFLMVGHASAREENQGDTVTEATVRFVQSLAEDAGVDPNQAYGGISLLAAWLSNQPAGAGHHTPAWRMQMVEDAGLALLARGADGCAAIEAWAEGRGCPDLRERLPENITETALLARAIPCPLAAACAGGYLRIVERILEAMPEAGRGALLDRLKCADGTPLLHMAAARSTGLLDLLLQAGANPRQRDDRGRTALHAATGVVAVRALLRAGAEHTDTDSMGLTAAQVWRRRLAGGVVLDKMLEALPASKQSMRDRVFLGQLSGARQAIEKGLLAEGCHVSLHDLAWGGLAARLCGLLGKRRLPSQGAIDWLAREGRGQDTWLRQYCLMAAAVVADRVGLETRNDEDRLIAILQMCTEEGGTPRDYESIGDAHGKMLLRGDIEHFPAEVAPGLVRLGAFLAGEGCGSEDGVVRRLFDTAGTALVLSNGLGGRVARLLQACGQHWPGCDLAQVLRGWIEGESCGKGSVCHDPVDAAQARLLADALAGLMEPDDRLDIWDLGGFTLPLWKSLLTVVQASGPEVWDEAGAAVLERLDATFAANLESYKRADGYADFMVFRKTLPDRQRLAAGGRAGRRRRA